MRSQYDENLESNSFFLLLKKDYSDIFQNAINKNWIIAVPRSGSLSKEKYSDIDFFSHVLVQTDRENNSDFKNSFKTLTNQKVVIRDSSLVVYSKEDEIFKQVQILFDETFYTENDKAFKLLCINEPINSEQSQTINKNENGKVLALNSVEDSKSFLWKIMAKKNCKLKVDELITESKVKIQRLNSPTVQDCFSIMKDLYLSSLQNVTSRRTYKRMIGKNENLKSSMMLALEMYICNSVFSALFPALTDTVAEKDEEINRANRTFQNIRASKSGIRFDVCENIPKARKEINSIRKITTPLEICECIRKVIAELSNIRQSKISVSVMPDDISNFSSVKTSGDQRNYHSISKSNLMVTSDDLLSALIFLVIKSEIPNWYAYLEYALHFRFASCARDDEYQYYLTTLEATLEHIRNMNSNVVEEDLIMDVSYTLSINSGDTSVSNWTDIMQTPVSTGRVGVVAYELNQVRNLFKLIESGQTSAVKEFIQRSCRNDFTSFASRRTVGPSNFNSQNGDHICHPLCNCKAVAVDRKSCQSLVERSKRIVDVQLIPVSKTFDNAESSSKKYSVDCNNTPPTSFSVASVDDKGWNALHQAAYCGQIEIVNILLEFPFLLDSISLEGDTAIHLAARRGHQSVILKLLDSGADINIENYFGQTALHLAAEYNHSSCVSTLVYFGSLQSVLHINTVNSSGNTALHIAATWGYESIVKCLLDNSASAIIKNNKGFRPADVASTRKLARILKLKAQQQEIESISKQTVSTLSKLIQPNNSLVNSQTNLKVRKGKTFNNKPLKIFNEQKDLLKSKPVINTSDGLTRKIEKLLKVVADGDLQMLKFLLEITEEEEINISETINLKHDLCHPLCQCSKCRPVQDLIVKSSNQQLNINSTNKEGFHCLHIAAIHDRSTIAKFLLRCGADLNTKTYKMELTPIHLAAIYGSIKVLNVLLFHKNITVNVVDKKLNTPLIYSCTKGNIEVVDSLLKAGALINTSNHRGYTPLHEAVRHNKADIVELLIQNGANLTSLNLNGLSPLDLSKDLKIYYILKNALHLKESREIGTSEIEKSESGMVSLSSSFYADQNTFHIDTDNLSLCSGLSVPSSEDKNGLENSSERLFPDDINSDLKSNSSIDKCDSPLPDVDSSLLERLDKNSKNNYRLIFKDPNSPSISSTNSSK